MHIEQFNPATDSLQLRACHRMLEDGKPADDPNGPPMSLPGFTGWWGVGWSGDLRETWLATDEGGEAVGCYLLELPELENKTVGVLMLLVALRRRRSGIGSALLRHAARRAALAGRTLLRGGCAAESPGAAFARASGARSGLDEVRRVLDVTTIPAGHLRRLEANTEPSARGYSLLSWQGPIPDAYLDQVAAVFDAMADAPRSVTEEPEYFDGARVRAADRRVAAQGVRSYSVAARCDATGELAALTQLGVDPEHPAWGHQALTAVTRPHRGHRLGLLVKLAMLELLAGHEPQLSCVITANSDNNKHMIAINDELGYQALGVWTEWELEIATAARSGDAGS